MNIEHVMLSFSLKFSTAWNILKVHSQYIKKLHISCNRLNSFRALTLDNYFLKTAPRELLSINQNNKRIFTISFTLLNLNTKWGKWLTRLAWVIITTEWCFILNGCPHTNSTLNNPRVIKSAKLTLNHF